VKTIFQHKEFELPDFRSEEDAANHLERLFQQIGPDPILLVLDDVWPVSKYILDKLKFRIENYKILVTSRYEFQSFGSTYKLETLNLADAMTLFQKLALPLDQQSYAPDQKRLEEVIYQPAIMNVYLLIFIWFSPSTLIQISEQIFSVQYFDSLN
jgi:hypothetical protein